ncbi:hypothetical protein Ccrd_017650, partial [Cynara cardunculus var. scolymus]
DTIHIIHGSASTGVGNGNASSTPVVGEGGFPVSWWHIPEFRQVQLEQQLNQNPNMIRDIINMSAIQNLMNNPEMMREIIDCNPELLQEMGFFDTQENIRASLATQKMCILL